MAYILWCILLLELDDSVVHCLKTWFLSLRLRRFVNKQSKNQDNVFAIATYWPNLRIQLALGTNLLREI